MITAAILIKRNIKLFFKDKGMFFTSLVTPVILLVLYSTFLGNVYKQSFSAAIPQGFAMKEDIMDALVGGQLVSSILAVSCVTVAFCSNFVSVQDKANGTAKDLRMSPVKPWTLSVGYYFSAFISTLLICVTAAAVCLLYLAAVGWYLSAADVLYILLDVLLLTVFGTSLSSVITFFLSTQGQISAVGAIISAGYGFICGAYMPVSQFSEGIRKAVMFLPGTYGTSLLRNHALGGALTELESSGFPDGAVKAIADTVDLNLYFSGEKVGTGAMYAVLGGSAAAIAAIYVIMNIFKGKRA